MKCKPSMRLRTASLDTVAICSLCSNVSQMKVPYRVNTDRRRGRNVRGGGRRDHDGPRGKISLGRKAEREQQRKNREQMREMINEAEGSSEEEDSDAERNAAYEAAQTRAGMDGLGRDKHDPARPKTPPKVTPLPNLSSVIGRLRRTLAEMEGSKKVLVDRMEELRKEKADIAVREVEIQTLIKEAGETYEKLRVEAGLVPGGEGLPGDVSSTDRGLESLGNSLVVSRVDSEAESFD